MEVRLGASDCARRTQLSRALGVVGAQLRGVLSPAHGLGQVLES